MAGYRAPLGGQDKAAKPRLSSLDPPKEEAMRDVTRKQVRILFELSNGKRLIVNETTRTAFLSATGTRDEADVDHYQSFLTLLDNDCLTLDSLGATKDEAVYRISTEGIERLLETSMRPEEG